MSSMGRTSTPGSVMSMSSIEMPACFFTSGSVRTSVKIQSPYWPRVVHVFCPLTTQSSPSRTAVVRRLARSEPASGSEKPCDHQMSRLAVAGRKRSFCSWLPNCAITGPIIEALKASGVGTPARCISSCHRWRCRSLQPATAPLLGPVRDREAGRVEDLLALHDLLAREVPALQHRVADLLRELGGEERAHLLAERGVLGGQLELHGTPLGRRPVGRPHHGATDHTRRCAQRPVRPSAGGRRPSRASSVARLLLAVALPRHLDLVAGAVGPDGGHERVGVGDGAGRRRG